MNVIRVICTCILSLSVICAVFLIFYSNKRRTMPGANYFFFMMFTAIIYNGAYIMELNSFNFSGAMFWFYAEHLAIPAQHYIWAMMSLEYVMISKKYFNIAKYALLYHPILYYLIFFTNHMHHRYISSYQFINNGYFPVIITAKGPLYGIAVLSGTVLGCITGISYIRGIIKSPKPCRSAYVIMIIASIFPWITVYLIAANRNFLGIDYYPIFTFASGILYLFGIFKLRIFKTIPIATEIVFRQSKEGIVLFDLTDRMLDSNNTFKELYPEVHRNKKKWNLPLFVKQYPEFKPVLEQAENFEFIRQLKKEKKYYSVTVNHIMAEDGLKIGKILIIDDITLYVEKQLNLEYMANHALSMAELNEVSFLQAQINPHFINNTLSVIASMITRAPSEAKELITYLGEYLADRYYFDSNSPTVLLNQELETVETYVKIEKARFGERLHYHLRCDAIPEVIIPRMVLQPLVENAIRHGILKKAGGGNVWLKINSNRDDIVFEIIDDGVGMTDETLAVILDENTANHNSIGLTNIHKRLLKSYNKGLTINSKQGGGTRVTFRIPFLE